jgi:dihydropteroate synthase
MGIVNVTPDSFYDGGKYSASVDTAVAHALTLIKEGADILDIGGESSRPGAVPVTEQEEKKRVIPVIETVRTESNIPISVDTYKSKIAEAALKAGANWINDITGFSNDEAMLCIAAENECPVIIMHMQGKPQTMQNDPVYQNVVNDLLGFFKNRISALAKNGIKKIILDPGIGFGKTVKHNLEILNRIDEFKQLGFPVMIGASRKSFIGKLLNEKVENRLAGSLAVLNWLIIKDVDLIRVHDVKESKQSLKILKAIKFAIT